VGLGFDPGSNIVDVYLRYLRKLGVERVETVRVMGYRLTADL
jgi:DNA-binding response OmpR family regulator